MLPRRRLRGIGIAAAVLVSCWLAGPPPARAQEAPPPANPAWTAKIDTLLKLDDKQQAAFREFVAAINTRPVASPALTAEQFRAMTMPQRLDYMAAGMASALASERNAAEAMHRFYALLSLDQRRLFDEATKPAETHAEVAPDPVSQPPPERPDYRLPSHTEANWLQQPSADAIARVYPSLAARKNISGRAVISCVADEDGYLTDCVVESETPPDQGFGNAALEITAYMRMKPATAYGIPVRSTVNVPVNFKMGG
jgi:TonB family protein